VQKHTQNDKAEPTGPSSLVRTAHVNVFMSALLSYTIQHRTVLITFPLYFTQS